jgi:signal transduction histidine kinase
MPDNQTRRANLLVGGNHRCSDRDIDGDSRDDAGFAEVRDGRGADARGATEPLPDARSRAELEAALGRAQNADRMKSVLLSTVCHELRTPLTAIKGFANALMDYGDRLEQSEKCEFLAGIDAASDRLAAMIDNLLAYSRLDAGMLPMRPIPTRVDEVVSSAVAQLGLRASGRHITLAAPPKLPMAMVDADGLCQVLDNLLVNALKYTPSEAGIRVECSESTHLGESAEEPAGEPAVRIRVQDEGPGIPQDHLQGIFQPFVQLDHRASRQAGGVGLGLAICSRIVEAHGGRIWAESTPGRGAAFVVSLPVAIPKTYYESRSGGRGVPRKARVTTRRLRTAGSRSLTAAGRTI